MKLNKVLIIDDEPLTCQLLAKVLELQGYETIIVTDGEQVESVVAAEKPSLILLDYHLGTSHGLEVLEALKNQTESKDIPVILTSGIDREEEALGAGAQAFLLKPFNWDALADLMKGMLEPQS